MVEIVPKKAPESQLLNVLFYISLVVFVLTIAAFFVFDSSIKSYQNKLQTLEQKSLQFNAPENVSLKKELIADQNKIQEFSKMADLHKAESGLFSFIEKDTHPQAWFSQFEANVKENQVRLIGNAKSFESLGQQILILRGDNQIDNVLVEKVGLAKGGGVDFSLLLYLKPETLKP